MISSRNLSDLHPYVQELAHQHILLCYEHEIDLLVYCTYRDAEDQNRLYAQGRTAPGPIVTNARGGDSMHNWRLAYDCVALVGGKPQWSDDSMLDTVGVLGEMAGLEWAGRWKGRLREKVHFQYTGGLTVADLKAGAYLA